MYFNRNNEETSILYSKTGILQFCDQIYLENCLLVYDFLKGNLPAAFQNTFILTRDRHVHGTRAFTKNSLVVPHVTTSNYGLKGILYKSVKDWNFMVSKTKDVCLDISKQAIKRKIKKQISDTYCT